MIRFGYINGGFVYFRKYGDSQFIGEFIDKQASPPVSVSVLYDFTHHVLKTTPLTTGYDPRVNPWFQAALQTKRTIWTDVYQYKHDASIFGTTVATPAVTQEGIPIGVFGVDVRLNTISSYLAQQKVGEHGEIFVLDKDDEVIAASIPLPQQKNGMISVSSLSRPWVKKAVQLFRQNKQRLFEFDVKGKKYLAAFRLIPILHDQEWTIAVIDEVGDFTHENYTIEVIYLFIVLGIFALGIMVMSFLVTRVVTPIRILVSETERIKNFNLTGTKRIKSRIKEVSELSDAIHAMKLGLRSFQKYVPAGLVRELIKAGEDAEISGTKRELAIFFSDIKDFTSITEREDSQQLVKQICDYYEILSKNIITYKGTIDKYIGDSIMAFWGAPIQFDEPCKLGARAALACTEAIFQMDAVWRNENWPVFLTNFGLHYGEVIVGSLGSSERLNYTAIGDAVNIANRLVNVNKIYGTSILVSETFYEHVKDDFVLRLVDRVTLKGKTNATPIYELMSEIKAALMFDIDAYKEKFDHAFSLYQQQKWDAAFQEFEICLRIYPQDTVAVVFMQRCKHFKGHPLQKWTGTWQLSEK